MNAAEPPRPGHRPDDVEELARLLPRPVEFDLPAGRHLHHKDLLMQHIDHDRDATAPLVPPLRRRLLPRRRLLRPAVLVPAASLALAGTLAVTLTGGPGDAPAASSHRAPQAVTALHRIADASLKTDAVPVKDSQFVYIRSLVRENTGTFDGPVKLGRPHRTERWMSQNPAPVTVLGWMRETGKDAFMPGEDTPIETSVPDGSDSSGAEGPGFDRPTYRWLASLPTDPDALLKLLAAHSEAGKHESRDQAVFETIGDMLSNNLMPPENAAALYRAMAEIPGVREVPDAVDTAGRHGIGITRDDPTSAGRDVWIFDKHSLALLGSRWYTTADRKPGRTDVLAGSVAILRRGIVDQHGMVPEKDAGTSAAG
ncbi:CU044_5270 family protein [Streptomyces montanisoli]|uniref:CU044_5270 family protein n=1 Tax=Streptomyces montanisoli TaxID=2798581 RepID=A0A940MBD5_9ACTN|nr:CU044_5270 family protein [Streptomyces montanisoli]MBP0457346.1 CU044_5270 family protein [Streptomyces montanisoli]